MQFEQLVRTVCQLRRDDAFGKSRDVHAGNEMNYIRLTTPLRSGPHQLIAKLCALFDLYAKAAQLGYYPPKVLPAAVVSLVRSKHPSSVQVDRMLGELVKEYYASIYSAAAAASCNLTDEQAAEVRVQAGNMSAAATVPATLGAATVSILREASS